MSIQAASHVLPVGFGRGRRANTFAVLKVDTAAWAASRPQVEQWAPEHTLSPWESFSSDAFMFGAMESGVDLVWRFWRLGESPEEVAQSLYHHDAVLLPAPHDEHLPVVDLLLAREVPVVLAYSRRDDPRLCWVACDNRGGIRRAVQHLIRLGHKRIGFIGGPRTAADFREREQGYFDALEECHLHMNPEWVTSTGVSRDDPEIRAAASKVLSASERPTAVVCATDPIALGVMEEAWELGLRVPDDVAVTGFDDLPEALQVIPHLTSVRQPTAEIANQACYLAICCVLGQPPTYGTWQLDLPTTLMLRESCGATPALPAPTADGASPEAGPKAVRQELEWRMRQLTSLTQELQELLSVASHDLRSPLITIQGFASMLQRKYGTVLDTQGKQYLDRIGRSVDSMSSLIDSLLTLSRANSKPLTLKPVQVHAVIERALEDVGPMVEKTGARLQIPPRLPTVLADEVALYQVFVNLLSNALKYLGDQPAPLVAVTYRTYPEEYEFTVSDNGIGIDPEHHEEVFQAFRRLAQVETEGAGIGLTAVKRIISRHGGRIWVDSQVGQGAAFRFTVPRRDVDYDNEEASPGLQGPPAHLA